MAVTGSDHLMIYGECTESCRTHARISKCDADELSEDLDSAPWHVTFSNAWTSGVT